MEIKQLKTFLAVADAKSFLRAADSLFVTRQALAKTIHQLEDELGVELFFRTQKGAMMTPAGIYFYPRAASIVAEFDKLKTDTMDLKRSYKPKISLCMSIGIYDKYASKLHLYRQQHSNEMQLSLRCCLEADAHTILGDRRADAIISFVKPPENIARSIKIGESPIVLMANKETLATKNVGITQLPKLLYNGGTEKALWWSQKPGEHDIISSDLTYLFSLLQNGEGILPIPKLSIPEYLTFASVLPAYPDPQPVNVYFSTLHRDHYNILSYTLLEAVYNDVIANEPL